MQQAYACTTLLGESISSLAGDEKKVKEVELEKAMTELKKAQDALSKALERRKADLLAAMKDVEDKFLPLHLLSNSQTVTWKN